MPDVSSFTCPNCGRVTPELVPVCECGYSYYPRAPQGPKTFAFKPLTLEEKRAARATGGMFLGILAVLASVVVPYGLMAAFLAILLSASGMKSEENRKRAVIGLVCGIIGVVLTIAFILLIFTTGWYKGIFS